MIEREAQYINTHEHGFLLVRETPDGWWLEHEKPEKNTQKQMQRHLDDDTVAYAWSISPRFTCKGGWAMDD